MKKTASVLSIIILLSLLSSCSSALPPTTPINTPYFNIISPESEGWFSESENVDSIILRRGRIGANLTPSDLPVQRIVILRKTVHDTALDELQLKYELKQKAITDIEDIAHKSTPDWIYGHYFDSTNYDKNNIYSVIYATNYVESKTLVQVYFYLPKYYKEWKKCYLLLYSEFPYSIPEDYGQAILNRRPFDLKLSKELKDMLEGFKCIEDSLETAVKL
jgi:hypothetical protein